MSQRPRTAPPDDPSLDAPTTLARPAASGEVPRTRGLPKLAGADAKPSADRTMAVDLEDMLDGAELPDVDVDDVLPPKPLAVPAPPPRPIAGELGAICTYGRFEIFGRIAFGGMAEIFLGRETSSIGGARMLAIKRILPHVADDPQFVEMFLDEARLAIQLNHPQICHIYEFGELDNSYFIAMEWIHGAQLGKMIRRARHLGGIPPETGARIIAYVAEALHYAHTAKDVHGRALGIVHRDVSPHNVMVSYDGQVKLLDFGIAKAQSHTTKTQAGVVKGKFSYMSPQQCLGKPIDPRADVFALGICLYEVLTGESLYHRETEYETMRAVIEDPVPSVRDKNPKLPAQLDAIVQKSLQKRAEDRYDTAADMQSALEDWLATCGKAVTTGRIAKEMERLFEERARSGPLVDSTPFGASFQRRGAPVPEMSASGLSQAAASARSNPQAEPPPEALPAPKKSRAGVALALVALVIAGAGGAFAWKQNQDAEARRQAAAATLAAAPPAALPEALPAAATPTPSAQDDVAPTAAQPGTLVMNGIPASGATVRVAGRPVEVAELGSFALPAGTHLVQIEHPAFRPWDREVEVIAGERAEIEVELVPRERAPVTPPGQISINTRPWSKVYVGQRLLGTTPIGEASVPSGQVRLRIVDRDGRTFTKNVRVVAGQTESVFFDLDQQ